MIVKILIIARIALTIGLLFWGGAPLEAFLYIPCMTLLGLIPATLAREKGRGWIATYFWWWYGERFFLVALIHSLFIREK